MDGKKQTGKKKPTDDSDEGFGLRTPARKETGKAERPPRKETGKAERPTRSDPAKGGTGKVERPAKSDTGKSERPAKSDTGKSERPAKSDTGKSERPAKSDTGKSERPQKLESGKTKALRAKGEPAAAGGGRSKAPLLVGALLVAGAAAAGLWVLRPEESGPAPTAIRPATPPTVAEGPKPPTNVQLQPLNLGTPSVGPGATPVDTPPPELDPAALQPLQAPGTLDKSTLEQLAGRSPQHSEVARILQEFADLFKADMLAQNPMLEDFQERQRREEELIARIRALGPAAASALLDMVLGLDNRAQQIFLAKGLAGIPGQETLDAVSKVLQQNKDVAIQTTLVRFLPQDAESAAMVARAFQGEQNPHLRTMLMRELSAREQTDPAGSSELFRRAALQDPDPNVRAEAVSIIGRRGEQGDAAIMEQLARNEQNVQIRQRAIVSYAETAGEGSLRFLEDLARDPNAGLPVRASAVLAIGRVGGDSAVRALETIAATDREQEIRTRAQRLAASLRARQQAEAQGPARVDEQPLRAGPGGGEVGPLQPR